MMLRARMRKSVNALLGRLFDLKVYSLRAHGREDVADIQKTGKPVGTILDVGANEGQSAMKFREAFPEARIFCFEPASLQFGRLVQALSGDSRISCHHVALGDASGVAEIFITDHSTMCSLIRPQSYSATE